MTLPTCCLAAAFATAAVTNTPAAFSTEAERIFAVPDIAERNVWLDCSVGFTATASNRVELALGPDADGDGTLGDDEAPFVLAVDCGRVVVRDGRGVLLHSEVASEEVLHLSLLPARDGGRDAWKIAVGNGTNTVAGVFGDGVAPLASWSLARVRLNGPEAASAQIVLQRNRHATVFLVR